MKPRGNFRGTLEIKLYGKCRILAFLGVYLQDAIRNSFSRKDLNLFLDAIRLFPLIAHQVEEQTVHLRREKRERPAARRLPPHLR